MAPADDDDAGRIHCRLDELLAERGMTLTRLAELVGVSLVNLSVLKNDRARAIRFSTLTAICDALDCTVGDLLVVRLTPAESVSRQSAGLLAVPSSHERLDGSLWAVPVPTSSRRSAQPFVMTCTSAMRVALPDRRSAASLSD